MRGFLSFAAIAVALPQVALSNPKHSLSSSSTPSGYLSGSATASISTSSPTTGSVSAEATRAFWLDQQDRTAQGRGYAPFSSSKYPVYRNVLHYSVVNDGTGDQSANLQNAINDNGQGGSREGQGTTYEPAEVYLPGGTYQLGNTLNLRVNTIIVGNPLDPPVIKAAPGFNGSTLVNGYDDAFGHPELSFMILIKNVIIDTTAVDSNKSFTALQWGVAQGCGLTNVQINMPISSTGHVGINLKGGSTVAVADVTIHGGAIGIKNSNQQVNFKNIHFKGCEVAFAAAGGWTVLLQRATFEDCKLGVNMTSNSLGSIVILDSISLNSPVVRFHDSSRDPKKRNSQILIENLSHDSSFPIAVDQLGNIRLAACSHVATWVFGSVAPGSYETGEQLTTIRPGALLVDGKFFTKAAPSYSEYNVDQFVNVKTVTGYPVHGDSQTDDCTSLNAILQQNAENGKITYFPYGVYTVHDTLVIPPGSHIIGEAWSVISGSGPAFNNSSKPRAVVQVGKPGDVGTVEIQEMRFTIAEKSPGAKVVEVNIAGASPGAVGIWNCLVTSGGTADTAISSTCVNQDPESCMAAFMLVHLTSTSSTYIENIWGWTSDHNLDGPDVPVIVSTGRGLLVEAQQGTWLTGTSFEHNWLYNYNFYRAKNVFAGMIQSETPYMQGLGAVKTVPAPWTIESSYGDPDYSWCAPDDQKCRTALATNVDGGSDIALYNSAAWAFFSGHWDGLYDHPCNGTCQTNMMRVANSPENFVWYSIGMKSADVIVYDNMTNPTMASYPGGWGGLIQAYRQNCN